MSATMKRTTSRRRVLASASGLGTAALLAACGQSGAGQAGSQSSAGAAKGKVTFMTQGGGPQDVDRYKPLIDDYNAKKGPVTIYLLEGDPGGAAVNAQGKLITMVAAG